MGILLIEIPGLNYYGIRVSNGSTIVELVESYSRLAGTSEGPDNGLLQFLTPGGDLVTREPYGVNSQSADYLSETTANLIPPNNSYVRPTWSGKYFFGRGEPGLNPIEGLWRHSDNLQNWTQNLAQEMTNNLAVVSPAPDTDEYDGIALQPQTRFKIRWCKYHSPTKMVLR